jgi:tRNA (guanine-N7-)-methyltransferase
LLQLEKIFFCFADPHFKKSNHRRRIISYNLLSEYAYVLREGGIIYTITDVRDLHDWMAQHLNDHPLFERIDEADLASDPCVEAMTNGTDEAQKVSRNGGSKFTAVFRRIAAPQ